MATLLEASDAPFVEKINGKEYTFFRWSTAALIPILVRIKTARVDAIKKYVKELNVLPREAVYMVAKEESANLDAHDAHEYLTSVSGIDECLVKSLGWAGTPEDEARKVVGALLFDTKKMLAIKAANIYELKITPAAPAAPAGQNDGRGFGDQGQAAPQQPAGFGEAPSVP